MSGAIDRDNYPPRTRHHKGDVTIVTSFAGGVGYDQIFPMAHRGHVDIKGNFCILNGLTVGIGDVGFKRIVAVNGRIGAAVNPHKQIAALFTAQDGSL